MAATAPTSNFTPMTEAKHPTASDLSAPIILDFGKHRRKDVKRLRQGEGRLLDEVYAALEELRASGAVAAAAQPVIIVVQQKKRRMNGLLPQI